MAAEARAEIFQTSKDTDLTDWTDVLSKEFRSQGVFRAGRTCSRQRLVAAAVGISCLPHSCYLFNSLSNFLAFYF